MTTERSPELTPRMQRALSELQAVIQRRYPTTTFAVGLGEDDPEAVHLVATVDLDDPDEVLDLVIERVLELQLEEELPLHVIPVRTPERAEQMRRAQARAGRHGRVQTPLPQP
jgi:hypothetical protein